MTIRPATEADLEAIGQIQRDSPTASHWDPSEYLDHDCVVAEDGGVICGFLVSRDLAGEREILNVAVDPVRRRGGIGRALLTFELSRPAQDWFLEVRESNQEALRFYSHACFQAVGKRPGYYDNPPESAIVMRFHS